MGCELGLGDELGLKKGTVERIVRELLVSSVLYASTAEALQGLSRPTPARGRGRQVECSPLRKTFSDTLEQGLLIVSFLEIAAAATVPAWHADRRLAHGLELSRNS